MSRVDRNALIWVGLGSLVGGLTRYLISVPWLMGLGGQFPWPTLVANIIGCMLIGFWFSLMTIRAGWSAMPGVQLAVMVGFCGGLTTFSIFSLETLVLIEAGEWLLSITYLAGSVPLWMLAVWAGFSSARIILDKLPSKRDSSDCIS